jgi:hypothetical protein
MVESEPVLDDLVFKRIKEGDCSIDDLLKMKKEYDIDILQLGRSIQRLKEVNLIKRDGNKYIINDEIQI